MVKTTGLDARDAEDDAEDMFGTGVLKGELGADGLN